MIILRFWGSFGGLPLPFSFIFYSYNSYYIDILLCILFLSRLFNNSVRFWAKKKSQEKRIKPGSQEYCMKETIQVIGL